VRSRYRHVIDLSSLASGPLCRDACFDELIARVRRFGRVPVAEIRFTLIVTLTSS